MAGKLTFIIVACLLTCGLITGCLEPMEFEQKSDNRLLSISVTYDADRTRNFNPVSSDLTQSEIQFRVPVIPNGTLSRMIVFVTIPASARIEPAFSGITDLSRPYRFAVIAENGDRKEYLLVAYH